MGGVETDNLSVVLYAKDDIRLENTPIRQPKENEVLLRMSSVGICGTDISLWKKGCLGADMPVTSPFVLGHESSGTVVQVGVNVKHLQVGDRVTIEPAIACRVCEFCKLGRSNLCSDGGITGLPTTSGHLSRFFTHPADLCYKLPDDVSLDVGALCEPSACAVNACKRGQITLGHTVLICGAGPIGLLTLLVAKTRGATRIVVTDLSESRLKLARELGATNTLLIDRSFDCAQTAKKVKDTLGRAPDVSIETSGSENGLKFAIYATKRGGRVVVVGLGDPILKVPILHAATREMTIDTVWCYINDFPAALDFLSVAKDEAKKLITHHYKLEEAKTAYETVRTGADNAIKVLIHC